MNRTKYEDLWKGKWNDTTIFGPACRHRRRIMINLVKSLPHKHVLDMGCGDGSFLTELSRKTQTTSLSGTDISETALSIARRNLPRAKFMQMDFNGQIDINNKVDVITLSEVLEYIENDDALLKQIAPICRYVVISVPGGPHNKVDRRYGHLRNYSGNLLKTKLEQNGFDVVLHKRWGWPIYVMQQYIAYRQNKAGAPIDSKPYSLMRRIIARIIYILYFLNIPRVGWQVFAIGHSQLSNDSTPSQNAGTKSTGYHQKTE